MYIQIYMLMLNTTTTSNIFNVHVQFTLEGLHINENDNNDSGDDIIQSSAYSMSGTLPLPVIQN